MRIIFSDQSYLEFERKNSKIIISQCSLKSQDGKRYKSISSSEITYEQFLAVAESLKGKDVESNEADD